MHFATIWNYIVLKQYGVEVEEWKDFATIWNYIVLKQRGDKSEV